MNLLLLPAGTPVQSEVTLSERQVRHVREVHRAQLGDTLRVGIAEGLMGTGVITALNDREVRLQIDCSQPPPPKAGITLLLALPRPKMLKRIVQMVTTLGVNELILLNSYRVEKSYWGSPWLAPEALAEQVTLGLEQAGDTVAMPVRLVKRFKPFVEDELPSLLAGKQGLVAHPRLEALRIVELPEPPASEWLMAIGPEGGFIPYEVEKLQAAGCQAVDLGERVLRVDTAVAVALGQLLGH